jgi:hypothetical protein
MSKLRLQQRSENMFHFVGFEVFTAVIMKSTIFWDITLCSPLSVNRSFGATYRLHFLGRKNKFSKKPAFKLVASLPTSFKTWFTLNGLHGAISQNMVLFMSHLFPNSFNEIFSIEPILYRRTVR